MTAPPKTHPLNIRYRHLLEPPAFSRLFVEHPPLDFAAGYDQAGRPVFSTRFDLLTTLEPADRARLVRLPLFRHWGGLLKWRTRFYGTTITEYAPWPEAAGVDDLQSDRASLVIIKDLPADSPLLPREDNDFARTLADTALARGFFEVDGQALAYVPVDFNGEEEYLARLSASRRKDLRRKLKTRATLEISDRPLGDACFQEPSFLAEMYAMYLHVYQQSEIHFDLLSPDFFTALLQSRDIEGRIFFYHHQGELVGYNLCLKHRNLFIDKYIGFKYPLARELNLYFVSWLVNLNYAAEKGFTAYVAGWTDPAVKASLGASFTFTRHLVWVRNPLLRAILRPFKSRFESDRRALESKP